MMLASSVIVPLSESTTTCSVIEHSQKTAVSIKLFYQIAFDLLDFTSSVCRNKYSVFILITNRRGSVSVF